MSCRQSQPAQPAQAAQAVRGAMVALCVEFTELLRHHLAALAGADGEARADAVEAHLSATFGSALLEVNELAGNRLSADQRAELLRDAPSYEEDADRLFGFGHAIAWLTDAASEVANSEEPQRPVARPAPPVARPAPPVDAGVSFAREYFESPNAGRGVDVGALLISARARAIASAPEYIEALIALCDAEAVGVARGSDLNALAADIHHVGYYLNVIYPGPVKRALRSGKESLSRRG